ncbi:hypothetical protein SAMN02746064_01344 [Alkalibacter saccharofermentans DSM 14828]|uniref:Uncharacterized protein n=1 Tax=Alkalibacter saccharofermentans DSM 14828 TaxID=1120975 RepID=A0A1M4WXF7_9FIRM|nr:hypothetical protein SAMN02746064_01344 [Alkalibacter saccharofermentans DSM 14828]
MNLKSELFVYSEQNNSKTHKIWGIVDYIKNEWVTLLVILKEATVRRNEYVTIS